jgi:PAS domain S-box-containing protein
MTPQPTYGELLDRIKQLEQKNATSENIKKELQESEKHLQDMVDNAAVGIYRTTDQGEILVANRKIAQIFGYKSPEEFLASVPNISLLYANLENRQAMINEMKNTGYIERAEVKMRHSSGQMIWVSINARAIESSVAATVYEVFVLDITEQKRAEEFLHESEERFRMLVEQAGDAFFIHDYSGKIFDINRRACESLGYTREELLELTIADIDIEFHRIGHKIRFWEPLAPRHSVTFEGVQRRKDGTIFPVEVRLSRLDSGGKKLLLSLVRDVTDRKRAENDLKKAFEEINELKNRLEEENLYLKQEIEIRYKHEEIIGESRAIKRVLSTAEKVAKENTCVLIQGETGTGKELLARAIHNMSPRKGRSMMKVNCAALPATLIESELFGRERGAFTGAVSKQVGRFEVGNGSTIFLDEIGDLPMEIQAKLLRVLQDGTFERLGSPETVSVDVRIIAATNRDLAELVKEERFRKDLFYRLNVFPITLPPLRERREDIPLLVWAFVQEFCQSMGRSIKHIPKKTIELFQGYSWPGNIRELRNVIEKAMILTTGSTLLIDRLDTESISDIHRGTLEDIEREHILRVLESTGWRVGGKRGASRILDLKESTLRSRMLKLGIRRQI